MIGRNVNLRVCLILIWQKILILKVIIYVGRSLPGEGVMRRLGGVGVTTLCTFVLLQYACHVNFTINSFTFWQAGDRELQLSPPPTLYLRHWKFYLKKSIKLFKPRAGDAAFFTFVSSLVFIWKHAGFLYSKVSSFAYRWATRVQGLLFHEQSAAVPWAAVPRAVPKLFIILVIT